MPKNGINNITLPVYKEIMKVINTKLIAKIEVSNIQSITDKELNELKVGDVVQKKTGDQKHCYIVTYKEENHGICLSYFDGSGYIENISYDYTDGHWVYNSKDVFEGQEKLVSGTNIKTINSQSLLGSGDIAISGGTKLYAHEAFVSGSAKIVVITNNITSPAYTSDYGSLYWKVTGDIINMYPNATDGGITLKYAVGNGPLASTIGFKVLNGTTEVSSLNWQTPREL